MTIKECIDIVDSKKPNQYTIKDKVSWLSFIDGIIINDVLKTHEGYDGRYDGFEGYSENTLSAHLIVPSPYDRLYTAYLTMRIDGENGETARYNSSAELFNSYMMEYRKYYNKTHMPLDKTKEECKPKPKASAQLPEIVVENIKRELYALLSEDVNTMLSDDKIYDIVMSYVNNNAAMLKGKDGRDGIDGEDGYTPRKNIDYFDGKIGPQGLPGKDGYTPQKGVDYWTPSDKNEVQTYIDAKTNVIKSDVEGIQAQINEESHFRGYLTTNAEIQALKATPNDFAYSAESGTQWTYKASEGWKDMGVEVPDQLTPASTTIPLINGVASTGSESAYARGDHRHPTDDSRASAEEVNELKYSIEAALDNIIAIQNRLIGGDA